MAKFEDQNPFKSAKDRDKWKTDWDFWRGYFMALKDKNKIYYIVPESYEQHVEKGGFEDGIS